VPTLGEIDRIAEGDWVTGFGPGRPYDHGLTEFAFVFSIAAVRGLRPGTAGQVARSGERGDPGRIVQELELRGLGSVATGWAAGGRVWGRMTFSSTDPLIANTAQRRQRLIDGLTAAARSLGPNVRFEVEGYGTLPPQSQVMELPEVQIVGDDGSGAANGAASFWRAANPAAWLVVGVPVAVLGVLVWRARYR